MIGFEPASTFQDLELGAKIQRRLRTSGVVEPTEVQRQVIPLLLEGADVLISAQAGSGKTLAYVLPIIRRLSMVAAVGPSPRGLVLVPNAKRAEQVARIVQEYGAVFDLRVTTICDEQAECTHQDLLELGCDIIVAIPDRLLQLATADLIVLSAVEYFVLDKADLLLSDAVSLKQVLGIAARTTADRTTALVAETIDQLPSSAIDQLVREPHEVAVSKIEDFQIGIRQHVVYANDERHKLEILVKLLGAERRKRAVVFARTKWQVEELAGDLAQRGVGLTRWIHAGKSPADRESTLSAFRRSSRGVLVATRDLLRSDDYRDVSHIINFDVPKFSQYRQSVGKTGRTGDFGENYFLVDRADLNRWEIIQAQLGDSLPDSTINDGASPSRARPRTNSNVNRDSAAEWPHIWMPLFVEQPESEDLLQMGLGWLKANPTSSAWHVIWKQLHRCSNVPQELVELALRWLPTAVFENRAWRSVFADLANTDARDEATEIVLDTLRSGNPGGVRWMNAWRSMWLMASPDQDEVDDLEYDESLGDELNVEQWQSHRAKLRDELRRIGLDAIAHCTGGFPTLDASMQARYPCHQIWRLLLRESGPDSAFWKDSMSYIQNRQGSHESWPMIWSYLTRHSSDKTALLDQGLAWLRARRDFQHPNWSVVWRRLAWWDDRPEVAAELLDILSEWAAREDIDNVTAFSDLVSVLPDAESLQQLGDRTLEAILLRLADRTEHDRELLEEWFDIWKAMFTANPRAELIAAGFKFLSVTAPSHWSWKYAWEQLQHVGGNQARLVEVGMTWLISQQERRKGNHRRKGPTVSWSSMWLDLWSLVNESVVDGQASTFSTTERDGLCRQLVNLARPWLATADTKFMGYGRILATILHHDASELWHKQADELLAEPALDANSWDLLWKAKFAIAKPQQQKELVQLLRQRFDQLPLYAPGWPFIWTELWSHEGRDENALIARGREWLESASVRARGWGLVWCKLAEQLKCPGDLVRAGIEWLQRAQNNRVSWIDVWMALAVVEHDYREQWMELGENWLFQLNRSHAHWADVLMHLTKAGCQSHMVRKLAAERLNEMANDDRRAETQQAIQAAPTSNELALFDGTIKSLEQWRQLDEFGTSNVRSVRVVDGVLQMVGESPVLVYYAAQPFSNYCLRIAFSVQDANHCASICLRLGEPLEVAAHIGSPASIAHVLSSGFEIRIDDQARSDGRSDFYGQWPEPDGLWKNRTGAIYKIPAGDRIWHQQGYDQRLQDYQPPPPLSFGQRYELAIEVSGDDYKVSLACIPTGESHVTTRYRNTDAARGQYSLQPPRSGYVGFYVLPGSSIRWERVVVTSIDEGVSLG